MIEINSCLDEEHAKQLTDNLSTFRYQLKWLHLLEKDHFSISVEVLRKVLF